MPHIRFEFATLTLDAELLDTPTANAILAALPLNARLLSKRGQVVAGYNVQIAVDDKHKLIVGSEVVNDGNDTGQLYEMAKAAKKELGVATLTALADSGYYNSNALKACEDDGIIAYVPPVKRTGQMEAKGRFTHGVPAPERLHAALRRQRASIYINVAKAVVCFADDRDHARVLHDLVRLAMHVELRQAHRQTVRVGVVDHV